MFRPTMDPKRMYFTDDNTFDPEYDDPDISAGARFVVIENLVIEGGTLEEDTQGCLQEYNAAIGAWFDEADEHEGRMAHTELRNCLLAHFCLIPGEPSTDSDLP